jgi:nitroreductase
VDLEKPIAYVVRPLPRRRHPNPHVGSSIYPAVQNMLLTARALGLGATLTTLYLQFEKEAEAALGLPPGVHS